MNILIISPQIYPCVIGGLEIFNYHYIDELANKNNSVFLLSNCNHNFKNKNIVHLKIFSKNHHNSPILILLKIAYSIIKNRSKFEIIHVPYTSNSPLIYPVMFLQIIKRIPYIVMIHGGGMGSWRPKRFHKYFFNKASAVFAVSEVIKEEYSKRTNTKITVIPPLIPFIKSDENKKTTRSNLHINENDFILISIGSIKRIKGSNILLSSFISLGKEFVEKYSLKLIFIGGGDQREFLKIKVKENGWDDYVHFLGSVPHEKVHLYYSIADVYIITSYFEGNSISLLEAMFNKLPIIASDISGVNNIIVNNENGLLFEKGNTEELKSKITLLVNNVDFARKLGLSAYNTFLLNFNYNSTIEEHISTYKDILKF